VDARRELNSIAASDYGGLELYILYYMIFSRNTEHWNAE